MRRCREAAIPTALSRTVVLLKMKGTVQDYTVDINLLIRKEVATLLEIASTDETTPAAHLLPTLQAYMLVIIT